MKQYILLITALCFSTVAIAQTNYVLDGSGTNCPGAQDVTTFITCGTSDNFYDDGGAAGNYTTTSQSYNYTFCSDDGSPITIDVNSLDLTFVNAGGTNNDYTDYIEIYDGSNFYLSGAGETLIYSSIDPNLDGLVSQATQILNCTNCATLTATTGCFTIALYAYRWNGSDLLVVSGGSAGFDISFDCTGVGGGGHQGDGANAPGPDLGNGSSPSNDFCGQPAILDPTLGVDGAAAGGPNTYTNINSTSGSGVGLNDCDPDASAVSGQSTLETTVFFQYCTGTDPMKFVDLGVSAAACVGISLYEHPNDGDGSACYEATWTPASEGAGNLVPGQALPANTCWTFLADGLSGGECDFDVWFRADPVVPGYWIGNDAVPVGEGYSTCATGDVVITDNNGTLYDSGGPFGQYQNDEAQVVSICPEGGGPVSLTINYDTESGSDGVVIYDDYTRTPGSSLGNVSGTGTSNFVSTGDCIAIYITSDFSVPDNGIEVTWTSPGTGTGFVFGANDNCSTAGALSLGTNPGYSTGSHTSGAAFNGGSQVGGNCDPDLVNDGACTSSVESTMYAYFQACSGSPSDITASLSGVTCLPDNTYAPQFYIYRVSGGCSGTYTYVDCTTSGSLTFTPVADAQYFFLIDGNTGADCDFSIDLAGGVCPPAALPLELLSFTAECNGKEARLEWATASEENVKHIIVQRAGNGGDFSDIAIIDATGTGTTKTNYSYTDTQPLREGQYRLMVVDLDGTYEFSDIVTARCATNGLGFVNIFPNPTNGIVNVGFTPAPSHSTVEFQLVDVLGRTVEYRQITATTGVNNIEVNLAWLPVGMYTLVLSDGTTHAAERIVKN